MNYLEYYGLQQEPFTNAPAIKFFYNSAQHSTALLRVMHAIEGMRGLALVLGQAGKGKTTLARRILEQLSPEVYQSALIVVVHASVEPEWFLKKIARQIGIDDIAEDKVALLAKVSERLFQIHRDGRKTVVLIDEAQMLRSREILEEMRGLLNIEAAESKLITFVLFGLPELDEVLEIDPPLKQRVATRVRLENLSREGAAQYVRHRMRLAGSAKATFGEDALDQLFLHTRGNPRLINAVCDNALLEGFLLGREVIDRALVDAVAHDLGLAGADALVTPREDDTPTAPATPAAVAAAAVAELDAAVAEWDEDAPAAAVADASPAADAADFAEDAAALLDDLTADLAEDAAEGPADGSVDLESLVGDDDAVLDELLSGAGSEPADGEVDLAALLDADDEPAGGVAGPDVDALLSEFEASVSAEAADVAEGSGADVDALLAEFEAETQPAAAAGGESSDIDDLLSGLEDAPAAETTGSDDLDDLLSGLEEEPAAETTGSDDIDDLLSGLEDAPAAETTGSDDLDDLLAGLEEEPAAEAVPAGAEDDIDALLGDLDASGGAIGGSDDVDIDALLDELPADSSELDVSGLEGAGDGDLSDLLSELEDDGAKPAQPADERSEIDDLLDQLGDLENG